MPDKKGRFQLYSDTSKFAIVIALYQVLNGQPKLIAYVSKRMPEAAKNYSITEMEMCGLAINFTSFAHLLKKEDFDAVVDHLAISDIKKSKVEPVMTKIKRLLELLSSYSFNLYYIKGKDMILSDFLSRQKIDDINPHEIILILFSMREVLQERYYNLGNTTEDDKYLVQTRSQAKSSGLKVPEVHGIEKSLVLHVKPERQKIVKLPTDKRLPLPMPRIGQGRVRIKRKVQVVPPLQTPLQTPTPKVIQSLPETVTKSHEIVQTEHKLPAQTPIRQPISPTSIKQTIGPRIEHREIPFYPDPFLRLPPWPPDLKETRKDLLDLDTDRNISFEENSPYQEGIILEMYEGPDRTYFKEPSEIKDLIDTTKLVQNFLPKRTDIDKILDILKSK